MLKSDLRQLYLSKQKTIVGEERVGASSRIADNFFSGFDLARIRFIHCFVPIAKFDEINTRLIFAKLWRDFPYIQTVVPRVDFSANEIRNLKFTHETELVRNAWGIEEPIHGEVIETEKIDMALVPGLCFDHAGHRVGYGKGFYDRLLKACRPDCVKIGLSYFDPVDRIDDVHDGDVRLDFVISPQRVYQSKPPA